MRTWISLLATLLSASFWLSPQPAHACSCLVMDLEESIDQAAAIFEGRVVSIEKAEGSEEGPIMLRVTFDVVRSFKGKVPEELTLRTADNSAACGYAFEKGTSYLVYAHDTGAGLGAGLCSRTQPIEQAGEDLAKLGAGVTPVDEPKETEAPKPIEPRKNGSRGGCGSCAVGSEEDAASALLFFAIGGLLLRRRKRG